MEKLLYVNLDGKTLAKLEVSDKMGFKQIVDGANRFFRSQGYVPENYSIFMRVNKKEYIPSYVLSDKKYEKMSPYSKMIKDESFLVYSKVLTGNKNLDLKVLSNLDDRSLLNVCVVNRYANQLCKDENFWRKRFVTKFGEEAAKYKPENRTWRNHYLKVISDLDQWSKPWEFFNIISYHLGEHDDPKIAIRESYFSKISTPPIEQSYRFLKPTLAPEEYQNAYWLLNLGNNIKIGYELDRYGELEPVIREYKIDTYFTPAKVMKLIQEFYDEPASEKEFQEHLEVDNPYAEEFTVQDARDGKIKRKYLIPLFFEGFNPPDIEDVRYIRFGS